MNLLSNSNKGIYGYINGRKKRLTLFCACLAFVIIAIVVAGLLIWKTTKNYLMVPALFTAIPFANLFATLMAYIKFKTPEKEKYAYLKHFDEEGMLLSELLVVDDKGKRYFVDFAIIYKGGIVAYTSAKYDKAIPTNYINNILKKRGVPMNIKLYDSWEEFTTRVSELEKPEGDELRKCELACESLLSVSM